ncbi:MAG: hypothetical protein GY764_00325 [Halieaceae bacterium]|nr:hypothetical protein [Halieaceae bacterium]
MSFSWLTTLWAAPAAQLLAWSLVAGLIGLLWGLGEIVGAFKIETGRAMRTGGAWLLILMNFAAAMATYLLVASVVENANTWLTAIAVGLAWPTVIRNTTLKLAQPLQGDEASGDFALRFEQAYAAVQSLARQLINATLTRQRMKLVTRATKLDLSELEGKARVAVIASPLPTEGGGPPDDFINRIMAREVGDDIKKAMLAAFILQWFDRNTLDDMLKVQRRKQRTRA